MPRPDALRTRRSFARLNKVVDVPNLIDIQRRSFDWLVDVENGGVQIAPCNLSCAPYRTDNTVLSGGQIILC